MIWSKLELAEEFGVGTLLIRAALVTTISDRIKFLLQACLAVVKDSPAPVDIEIQKIKFNDKKCNRIEFSC